MNIKFKDYLISKPVYLDGREPDKWAFTLCKLDSDSEHHFVIADFWWNSRHGEWEFKSVGVRYLKYYTEGLDVWLLKVMEMFQCAIAAEESN